MFEGLRKNENTQSANKDRILKKRVKTLIIISIAGLVILIVLNSVFDNKGPREEFLGSWFTMILAVFIIPLMFEGCSLAANVFDLKPKTWLTIYICAVVVYAIIVIKLGFINMTKDLSLAIKEDYSVISGKVIVSVFIAGNQTIEIGDSQFVIPEKYFEVVNRKEEYTIYYLPNCKTVIEVINNKENISLRK